MKYLILTLVFFSSLSFSFGQLDLNLQYERPTYGDWDQVVNELYRDDVKFLENSFYFGVGYRYFPFPFRLGFVPELGANYAAQEKENSFYQGKYELLQINLSVPVQVFPFDLYGDCNCPTFGKQNDFLKKAVYFKFIPGISYQMMEVADVEINSTTNLIYSLGAGMGMNIALSNLFTIAPEISYHYIFSANWEGFSALHGQPEAMDHSSANKFSAGLRFSFYFE